MIAHEPDTDDLRRQSGDGDRDARNRLLARHRDQLRKMARHPEFADRLGALLLFLQKTYLLTSL